MALSLDTVKSSGDPRQWPQPRRPPVPPHSPCTHSARPERTPRPGTTSGDAPRTRAAGSPPRCRSTSTCRHRAGSAGQPRQPLPSGYCTQHPPPRRSPHSQVDVAVHVPRRQQRPGWVQGDGVGRRLEADVLRGVPQARLPARGLGAALGGAGRLGRDRRCHRTGFGAAPPPTCSPPRPPPCWVGAERRRGARLHNPSPSFT